ncbi:WD40 repeat domain-containing protein [Cohnella endophytica]|uniref:WD40 repeat domain-containing protein n=1 Tax=Cohnella endophytica TaxID=2419778 RepID=UPI0018F32F4E|nr:WD40 repeat domain-containing protein [Cohnella endophytica]
MRKYHQEQVLELIKTLFEAHRELIRLYDEQRTNAFIGLLADCQECAIQIGLYIESHEGVGTATVSLFEEYCEILYFTSNEIDNGGDASIYINRLLEQLGKIRNSATNELKQSKIEIAFLPYKASMWDSCESVWMAANEDPQCDAYVIPIPYFDRNSDGTVGQMHYEGNQFPEYVPIVDWQNYNLEERRPDIIVTINPYDNGNMVTVVHPDYFCQRLKDLTDLLVYIPYFVSLDDVDAHFCTCAGVLHADRVIVQSEKIRQTYIRVIQQFELKNQCTGYFGNVGEKIVALGSPKFDKVINSKREDYALPDSWSRLIERADGSRKKVVLYNTSIASLLEGNEKVLVKLRDVFAAFRKRNDVVLLWRPHPLNQSTYQSMRPQLLAEYDRIVEEYKRNQFGIYDDTADLHRAIALSDAYYGDMGSVVALYACTGKPIMLQHLYSSSNAGVGTYLLHDDGHYYWISAYEFNGLFRVNKETMIAEYIGSFPEEKHQFLHMDVAEYEKKLYFAPFNADYVAIFDKEKKQFDKRLFPIKDKPHWLRPGDNRYFSRVITHKQQLFFVPYTYPAIMRYDPASGETVEYTEWIHHLEKAAKQSSDWQKGQYSYDFEGLLSLDVCIIGSEVVASTLLTNELLFFDIENLQHQFYAIGENDERYFGVCFDGEHYWLAARTQNYIVKWNRQTQKRIKIELPSGIKTGQACNFQALVYANGYVWLFPQQTDRTLKVDIHSNAVQIASMFDEYRSHTEIGYINVINNDEMVYALMTNRVMQWDAKNQLHRYDQFAVSENDTVAVADQRVETLNKLSSQLINVIDTLHLEAFASLDTYLDYVTRQTDLPFARVQAEKQIQLSAELTSNLEGTSGTAIHQSNKQVILSSAGGKR